MLVANVKANKLNLRLLELVAGVDGAREWSFEPPVSSRSWPRFPWCRVVFIN